MSRTAYALTADGSLTLVAGEACADVVAAWLPRMRQPLRAPAEGAAEAVIEVVDTVEERPAPAVVPPTLHLFGVAAHVDDGTGAVDLRSSAAACTGRVDLRSGRARIHAPANGERARVASDLFTMLTVSSAMLLGRLRRALVHSAAVVDPTGRAWLLVGDTHAGKTTTTLNLVQGGWRFLSDDHVVVSPGADPETVEVEGWPRPFHVDEGWEQDRVTNRRVSVDPGFLGPDRWHRSARLAGLLFPRVRPDAATHLESISAGTALADLVRQTPWFLADRVVAPGILELLRRMAQLPAHRLSVGRETYRNPSLLLERCASLAALPG